MDYDWNEESHGKTREKESEKGNQKHGSVVEQLMNDRLTMRTLHAARMSVDIV